MIVRPRPGFFSLFFIVRGSVVPRILPEVIGLTLYSIIVVALLHRFEFDMQSFTLAPFGLIGITLSIYLGFRNSAAYDRWWEARKLWGQLVYEIRNLSRAATSLIEDRNERRRLLMDSLAFCHMLRGSLRGVDVAREVESFLGKMPPQAEGLRDRPDCMVRRMGDRIGKNMRAGHIDMMSYRILDERLASLAALQAGCERIAGTPLPFAYTLLLHRTTYLLCLLLPIALASTTGWATPFFSALFAYTFFGLDELSFELEDPFGKEANDLALDGLCRVCEIAVMEALGEVPPPKLPAKNGYYFS